MRENLKKEYLLGVGITAENEDTLLEYILKGLDNKRRKLFIVTPNPEIIVYANKHTEFKRILNEADIALPDGTGLFLASRMLAKSIKSRITGVDFMERLCMEFAKQHKIAGFLGGRGNVAERTAERLVKKYPGLKVVFAASEWPDEKVKSQKLKVKSIDMLFVAFGFPRQEEWIYKNLNKLPVKAAMGVGGAFDYISATVPRAPGFIRALGLEWLFRLTIQPWRIKRQTALIKFMWLVLMEYLRLCQAVLF